MSLLEQIHPGFFELPEIKNMPGESKDFDEMLLELAGYDENDYIKPDKYFKNESEGSLLSGALFQRYEGSKEKLFEAVSSVNEDWIKFYVPEREIYTIKAGDKIASFGLISNFGSCEWNGKKIMAGGPSCIGTVPEFRRQGMGLALVRRITSILRQRGFDISYVHWTEVPGFYAKLGYKTVTRWNKNGICSDEMDRTDAR